MKRVIHLYRLLNILSVDIAIGAVIGAVFFAEILDVHIKSFGLISLGLTVWIIYTLDHLMDARNTKHKASTVRHRFHQQYFKGLFYVVIVAALIDVAQIFFIKRQVLFTGLLLAILVVIYFFVQRYLRFIKELFGALLYSCGVMLAPISLVSTPVSSLQILLMIQFGITALINLLLFSWFDKVNDDQDKHRSFATFFGAKPTLLIVWILLGINIVLGIIQTGEASYIVAASIILIMNMILFLITVARKYFYVNGRYRLLGDAIFFLPITYIIM